MDFYGCHFEYAGEMSRKYGLIIANIETQRNRSVSGKTQSVYVFNKRSQAKHTLGTTYTEAPLVFDMEVVTDEPIDGSRRRAIQKWLFNHHDFQKLYLDRADDNIGEVFELTGGRPVRSYLNCRFVNPEKIEGNGGIVGYKFTAECDSRMAWQDPISVHGNFITDEDTVNLMTIAVDTDTVEYTYPLVAITTGATGGQVCLVNISDDPDRKTLFYDIPPSTTFVVNGVYNYVSDGYYSNFVDRNFPRLLDGKNTFEISGDVSSVSVTWQNVRYL